MLLVLCVLWNNRESYCNGVDIWFWTGKVMSEKYTLEYGTDCLEMHIGAVEPDERALVVDDLIATGGTLCAAMNLLGTLL